jgi:hypothetical protein
MLALAGASIAGIGRATFWTLVLGAAFAGIGSVVSSLRLFGYRQAELPQRSQTEKPPSEAAPWTSRQPEQSREG